MFRTVKVITRNTNALYVKQHQNKFSSNTKSDVDKLKEEVDLLKKITKKHREQYKQNETKETLSKIWKIPLGVFVVCNVIKLGAPSGNGFI